MPTQVDTPIAVGATSNWGLYGSGATSAVVAVQTNDGDTSVIYASSGGAVVQQLYQFPQLVGVADPVTSASLTAVTREYLPGAGGRDYRFLWNSTEVGPNQTGMHAARPNYVSNTYAATGTELAISAVNGEHGLQFKAAGGPSNKAEYWVTQFYRTVVFEYGLGNAGEFAYMVGSLVGALVGGNLLLREMPALSRFMGRIRLSPDELLPAWIAWTEYRHPVYGV
jgi:hypothetical protein